MKKILVTFLSIGIIILIFGCDKERTITSTEYIHEIEYRPGPTDTILVIDTLLRMDTLVFHDTTTIRETDTMIAFDTVYNTIIDTQKITEYIFDTVVKIENFYDTVMVNHTDTDTILVVDTLLKIDTLVFHDTTTIRETDTMIAFDTVFNTIVDTQKITEYIFDTVVKIDSFYDTVVVNHIDTVTAYECQPFVHFAFTSLQYYANTAILDFINTEFGYTDGWIYYLTITQSDIQSPSAGVYDIYGYVDYWTTDFASFYPLEYYWRISYLGGDPSDPENWELSDPPTRSSTSKTGGVKLTIEREANVVGTSVQLK